MDGNDQDQSSLSAFDIKIVDLVLPVGHINICFDIQTRQYRCPELLLAQSMIRLLICGPPCLIFELAIGDLLMIQEHQKRMIMTERRPFGANVELMGKIPKKVRCLVNIQNFFNKKGELKILLIYVCRFKRCIGEKYHFKAEDAKDLQV